jgi:hypothetical protein
VITEVVERRMAASQVLLDSSAIADVPRPQFSPYRRLIETAQNRGPVQTGNIPKCTLLSSWALVLRRRWR